MRQWLSALLKTVLSQKISLLLAAAWVPIITAAVSVRHYLAQFVPQPAEEWAVLTTASSLAGLLTAAGSYFWIRPKFTEFYGAFFKRNPNGGYHDAVYCGNCKSPTSTQGQGIYDHEKFICHCGWKSSFTLGQLKGIRAQLPEP